MTHLPVVSGKDASRALERVGYEIDHQTGSHIIMRKETPPFRRLTIPNHKELAKGTLRAILRDAGLTPDEFRQYL